MDPTTVTSQELFTPVEHDYAIGILRRIFGSTVDNLFSGGANAGGEVSPMLTTVIGLMNIGVLMFGVFVASYTIYSMVFNTANDGDPAGRETKAATTFLRVGVGSLLLLPVSGGFSVVQIIVLQMLIFGSGFADTMWNRVADVAKENNAYTLSMNSISDDFLTAGKFAEVYHNRLLGHLCMLHANRTSEVLGTGSAPVQPVGPVEQTWYFSDGNEGVFGGRTGMCGSLKMALSAWHHGVVSTTDTRFTDSASTYADNLRKLAADAARASGMQAVAALDADARQLAQEIYAGNRSTESYKTQILAAIDKATVAYKTGISQGISQGVQSSQLSASLMEVTKRDGWMFAAVWQRSLSSYNDILNKLRNSISFEVSNSVRPNSAVSVWGSMFPGAEERALFEAAERDFAYVRAFEGTFQEAGSVDRVSAPTALEEVNAASRAASWASPVQWTYSQIFGATGTNRTDHWRDPLLELQDQGNAFTLGGAAMMAAAPLVKGAAMAGAATSVGTAASAIGTPAAGLVAGYAAGKAAGQVVDMIMEPIGYLLIILGMILGVVLPFLPFAYFTAGTIGWVLMAVEALIAAPLWCLLTFAPSRDGDFLGTNKQGLLLLIGVFLRPAFMIVGLIVCYVLLRVGLDFVTTVFSSLYMIMTPDQTWSSVFTAMGLMGMYVMVVFALVTNAGAAITGLGDAVMEWIGVHVSKLGNTSIGDQVVSTANPMGRGTQAMLDVPGQMKRAYDVSKEKNAASRAKVRGGQE